MSDTGAKVCATVESSAWTVAVTTTRINTSDNSDAQATGTSYLEAQISDFSFGIPSGSTINGISIAAEFAVGAAAGPTAYLRLSLSYNDGANWTATKEDSNDSDVDVVRTYGGASDTWGRTWSDSEFANGFFRLKLEGKSNNASYHCDLDYLTVTVYYTPSGGAPDTSKFFIMF